jgi:hypothetical protein
MGYYNNKSGRNKKGSEIWTLKVEGRKINDEHLITENLMSFLLLLQEILKDKVERTI